MNDVVFGPGEFTGRTDSWRVADALLSDVFHTAPKVVPEHMHAFPYFSVLLDGSYRESAADFTFTYEPYSLIFHAARTPHTDAIGEHGCHMFFVELLDRWSPDLAVLGETPSHLFELDGSDPCWITLRLYREFLQRESASITTIESLIYELCTYVARIEEDDREPPWLAKAEAHLKRTFSSGTSLAILAEEIGVHPAHLCRSFRRFRAKTVGDYVTNLRIQDACRRLSGSDAPLSQIAFTSGFSDQSHMSKVFKRATGYSPGTYRAQHKAPSHSW